MVKIKKGNLTAVVTYETFKNHYEKNGWQLRVSKGNKKVERINADTYEETEVETNNPAAPLAEEVDLNFMKSSEMKAFAAERGIDISAAQNKEELRAIIEAALAI